MVSKQKSSACRHILHRPLSKSSLTPGTPGQKQTKGSKLGIHLKDIPQLISAVLLLNYFVVGQTLIEQFRGAPMGSPCSPALCNLVVAVEEQCWRHTYAGLFFNRKFHQHSPHQHAIYFATRYVDNRVSLLPEQLLSLPPFKQLTHLRICLQAAGSA